VPINAGAQNLRGHSCSLATHNTTGWAFGVSERQLAINPTVFNQWQVFIQQIYSNTPAATAGFRDGDHALEHHEQ